MSARSMFKVWIAALIALTLILSGCGKEKPKEDVTIFMAARNGITFGVAETMEAELLRIVGESPSVKLQTVPVFMPEKVVVEIAVGGHSILILPEDRFKGFFENGKYYSLDDIADPELFPEGLLEDPDTHEMHLYGIPVHHVAWLKEIGYEGEPLFAFIPSNAKNVEDAKTILEKIAVKD